MGYHSILRNKEGFTFETTIKMRKSNNLQKYFKEYTRNREEGVLTVIQLYDINGLGIAHGELAKAVGLDRKNLRRYTKNLIKQGSIKKEGGKQGKYFLTQQRYADARLAAYLVGSSFSTSILPKERLITTKVGMLTTEESHVGARRFDFERIYSHHFEPKFTKKSIIEHAIFEFSNKVGAFITFMLIQAAALKNRGFLPILKEKNIKENEENELIRQWANNAITPVIPFLTSQFRDSVFKALDKYPRTFEEQIKYTSKQSLAFDKEISDRLSKAFGELYPLLDYELTKIIAELPGRLIGHKQWLEKVRRKWKSQETCQHEYGKPREILHGYGKVCSKCNYIKALRKRNLSSIRAQDNE